MICFLLLFTYIFSTYNVSAYDYTAAVIKADNIDDLVLQGAEYIKTHGIPFHARAGSGIQASEVTYVLTNPKNRLHLLRKPISIRYFCRELIAYFSGSLFVEDGLAQASSFWRTLADLDGKICSNYGYYVFHQKVSEFDNKSQYDWVIENLLKNSDSRKAFININQPHHKNIENKDFPCTLGMQFFIQNNYVCCVVASRSTDIYTGLPYDMGFFSLILELVYKDLQERLFFTDGQNLKLGFVAMKTNFTQIYDKTKNGVMSLLEKGKIEIENIEPMPEIENAQLVLHDIYFGECTTPIMQWIKKYAQ